MTYKTLYTKLKIEQQIFGVFRVNNYDFTPKYHIFSTCGGRRENFGYFVWEITILCQKILFFPIWGGGVHAPWIHPCEPHWKLRKNDKHFVLHYWHSSCYSFKIMKRWQEDRITINETCSSIIPWFCNSWLRGGDHRNLLEVMITTLPIGTIYGLYLFVSSYPGF